MLQNVGKPSNLLSNGSKAKYYPPKLESKQKKKTRSHWFLSLITHAWPSRYVTFQLTDWPKLLPSISFYPAPELD